jgi:hypothetical protein
MHALLAMGTVAVFAVLLIVGAIVFVAIWFALIGATEHKNHIIRLSSKAVMYPILAVFTMFLAYALLTGGGGSYDPDDTVYHRPP